MRTKIPIQIIELETDNYHIMVSSVGTNGTALNWIVDTGASKTVLDKNLVEHYSSIEGETDEIHSASIGEEPMDVKLGRLNVSQFGNVKVEKLKVALLDLSHINELYSKSTDVEINGLLGGDFLVRYNAVIDYKKSVLKLYH